MVRGMVVRGSHGCLLGTLALLSLPFHIVAIVKDVGPHGTEHHELEVIEEVVDVKPNVDEELENQEQTVGAHLPHRSMQQRCVDGFWDSL